jgi:hypothetical protein
MTEVIRESVGPMMERKDECLLPVRWAAALPGLWAKNLYLPRREIGFRAT